MAGRVLLIEGLDLAGKSTLVGNLHRELTRRGICARVCCNALCPENPIARLADQLRRDPQAGLVETGTLFLAAHLWDARHFTMPPDGMVHIQDSCWLRTLAYHCWKDTPAIPEQLARAARYFPRFDAAVFLTAGIEERQCRLAQRDGELPGSNDEGDHAVARDAEGFQRHERLLRDLTITLSGAHLIDTTRAGKQEVLERALESFRITDQDV